MSTPVPVILTIPQNGDSQAQKDRISKLFPKRTIFILSFTQLFCAALAVILQVNIGSNYEIYCVLVIYVPYFLNKNPPLKNIPL
jgi:hypothetical protein